MCLYFYKSPNDICVDEKLQKLFPIILPKERKFLQLCHNSLIRSGIELENYLRKTNVSLHPHTL